MDMNDIDSATEMKPCLYLDSRQVKLQKAGSAQVGETFLLGAMARVTSVSEQMGENGETTYSLTLELNGLTLEPEQKKIDASAMYPAMGKGE